MSSSIVIYNGLKILCPVAGCYLCLSKFMLPYFAANNCMFKVSNRKTRARCGIYSKLTIKTLERHQWRRSDVFIVNLEQISHLVLVFLLYFEQVNTDCVEVYMTNHSHDINKKSFNDKAHLFCKQASSHVYQLLR